VPTQTGSVACANGLQTIKSSFAQAGLSQEVSDFLMNSWRTSTRSQYDGIIRSWMTYCNSRGVNVFDPTINQVLEYLLHCFRERDYSYSSINSHRSALSTIIQLNGKPAGQHPLVVRFVKACFNSRPQLSKLTVTWDVDIVLAYLKSLSPVKSIPMSLLTHKVVMLLLLLSGQRGQSLHLLDVRNMKLTDSRATFQLGDLIKQSRPGSGIPELAFKAYAPDRRLCIITTLRAYLSRTEATRSDCTQLLLTYRKPVHAASRDSIRRWTKAVLQQAGVDLSIFRPHSTRSASTSKVATKLPLSTILATAGWSNESTFTKYYQKPVASKTDFGEAVLQ
jgi:hypothetical protein